MGAGGGVGCDPTGRHRVAAPERRGAQRPFFLFSLTLVLNFLVKDDPVCQDRFGTKHKSGMLNEMYGCHGSQFFGGPVLPFKCSGERNAFL